jgi:hypothetical protein
MKRHCSSAREMMLGIVVTVGKSLGPEGPGYRRWARRYRMETVELLVHRGSLLDELGR